MFKNILYSNVALPVFSNDRTSAVSSKIDSDTIPYRMRSRWTLGPWFRSEPERRRTPKSRMWLEFYMIYIVECFSELPNILTSEQFFIKFHRKLEQSRKRRNGFTTSGRVFDSEKSISEKCASERDNFNDFVFQIGKSDGDVVQNSNHYTNEHVSVNNFHDYSKNRLQHWITFFHGQIWETNELYNFRMEPISDSLQLSKKKLEWMRQTMRHLLKWCGKQRW